MKRFAFFIFLCLVLSPRISSAKIYIDIEAPGQKQFRIAMYDLSRDNTGMAVTRAIKNDLSFTGLFSFLDEKAFIENAADDFNRKNWIPLGVDAVLKGAVKVSDKVTVEIRLYDVSETNVIIYKQYRAEKGAVDALAHSISNDIYSALTGQGGIFRSKIAFIADRGKTKDLMVMDYDGNRLQKTGFSRPIMLSPHWSKDGSRILISCLENRQWSIHLIDFRQMTARNLYGGEGVNIAGDFSPSGDSFAFSSSKGGAPNLYLYDLSSGKVKRLTSNIWIDISPSFSPDGKEIAFVSNRSGNPHIYVMDIDGYNVRRITFEGTYNTSPSWSPKGDLIAFTGMIKGKNQVFTVRPDGSDARQLTNTGNNEDPVFSPDGRYIAFTSDREGYKAIYTMRSGGEGQKRITPEYYRAFGPEWRLNTN